MFEITYHYKIPEDLERISTSQRKMIRKAIEEKLMIDPQFFGKPLQFSLQGLRSMRVGDYRVVFQLLRKEVFVVLIEHRSRVYKNASKRM